MIRRRLGLALAAVAVFCAVPTFAHGPDALRFRYVAPIPQMTEPEGRAWMRWLTQSGFDVAGINWNRRTIEIIGTRQEIAAFEAGSGVKGHLGPSTQRAPDPRYYNPERAEAKARQLAKDYPEWARFEEIGKTLKNRNLVAVAITAPNPTGAPRPAVIFDALHHAREIITPDVALDLAEGLLKDAKSGKPETRALLEQFTVWVVPMVNPDGSNIVWTSDSMWRKNARPVNGTVRGVDINRNYAYQWGACDGSSGNPTSETYRGTSPASEPETQALAKLGERIRPVGGITFHSYGELVLYPYGCEDKFTPENALMERLGHDIARNIPSDDGGTYQAGTTWQMLYAVDGGSKDFFFSQFGTLEFTIEIGTDFHPPWSERDPTVAKIKKAAVGFMEDLGRNLLSVEVVDGTHGVPAQATIEFDTIVHISSERPFVTSQTGTFFKVLDPGVYEVTATLADGRTASVDVRMDGKPQKLELRVD
jgi:carboxypeptidase T